jgi:hypothetical protein
MQILLSLTERPGTTIPALVETANRVKCKQAGNLCGGLRWAAWDAMLGASDEGEGRGIAGGRARKIFKCAGERVQGGVPLARGRGYLCSA